LLITFSQKYLKILLTGFSTFWLKWPKEFLQFRLKAYFPFSVVFPCLIFDVFAGHLFNKPSSLIISFSTVTMKLGNPKMKRSKTRKSCFDGISKFSKVLLSFGYWLTKLYDKIKWFIKTIIKSTFPNTLLNLSLLFIPSHESYSPPIGLSWEHQGCFKSWQLNLLSYLTCFVLTRKTRFKKKDKTDFLVFDINWHQNKQKLKM
jgi:hypothetical protein